MVIILMVKKLIWLLGKLVKRLNINRLFFSFWNIKLNVVDFNRISIIMLVMCRVVL